jgi:hypothetical protein
LISKSIRDPALEDSCSRAKRHQDLLVQERKEKKQERKSTHKPSELLFANLRFTIKVLDDNMLKPSGMW